jgi:hypothetical protein
MEYGRLPLGWNLQVHKRGQRLKIPISSLHFSNTLHGRLARCLSGHED